MVLLATGRVEGALRGVGELGELGVDCGGETVTEWVTEWETGSETATVTGSETVTVTVTEGETATETETDGRIAMDEDSSFLGEIAMGGDGRLSTLLRSLYQRQVRCVGVRNRRMKRRVRRLCRWIKGVEEKGRRVWHEGRRAWREGRMWEVVKGQLWEWRCAVYFLVQTVCVQVFRWVFIKSAEALGRWSSMKGWMGISGKIANLSFFLLFWVGGFRLIWRGLRELKGWDGTVWKIGIVLFYLLMAFWGVRSIIWGIGPPWTKLSAVKR